MMRKALVESPRRLRLLIDRSSLTTRLPQTVRFDFRPHSGRRFYQTKLRSRGMDIIAQDGSPPTYFDYVFLRDSCQCPRCVDPSTQQRLFVTADLHPNIAARKTRSLQDSSLEVTWENDIPGFEGHTSVYAPEFIHRNSSLSRRIQGNHNVWKATSWDKKIIEANLHNLNFDFLEYMTSKATILEVARSLLEYGLVFINNVPIESSSVKTVAERIGPLRNTFYGETWDVRSVPSAKNVAYTSKDLGFHQDLLYMADPPGLQLLHMMKPSASGGESLFSDGLRAFYSLQEASPALVSPLQNFPVTYRYHNDGHWYQRSRPTLEGGSGFHKSLDSGPLKSREPLTYPLDFDAINWSPPFQGPLEHAVGSTVDIKEEGTDSSLRAYLEAASHLKGLIQQDDAVYETSMQGGTCAIFNNRRVMHARNAFDTSGGERWLRGAYVDGDCLRSLWRSLSDRKEGLGLAG